MRPTIRRVLPLMTRRRRPMGDRLEDAGEAGSRLARRAWGAAIAGLLAADVLLTATGTENRWSHLIDACLGQEQRGQGQHEPPAGAAGNPRGGESLERLMGPGR